VKTSRAQILIGTFLFRVEKIGGPDLFAGSTKWASDDPEDWLIHEMTKGFYGVFGTSLGLCDAIKEGLATPTTEGEKSLRGFLDVFCKHFGLDFKKVMKYSDEKTLQMLNDLFSYTGKKEGYAEMGHYSQKFGALLEILPLARYDKGVRKYRLKK